MAHWIDRALIWLFAAFSFLLFFLVLTDGQLILSVASAFACTVLLRILLHKLPEKHLFCRRKQLRLIDQLLEKWALADEKEALSELRNLLPKLFDENDRTYVRILQRLPDGEAFSANKLLEFHRAHPCRESLTLLCTGPVSSSALSILPQLKNPSIRLIDSRQLIRLLLKSGCPLPSAAAKKERCELLSGRIALLSHSIRPVRSGAYSFVFFVLYLLTRNSFYLASALFFFMQLIVFFISRLISAQKAA